MALNSDVILDRINLKKKVSKWQMIALITAIIAIIIAVKPNTDFGNSGVSGIKGDYIARVEIDGVIMDDSYRRKVLNEIAENKNTKALILAIDSPGGTTSGGEDLYFQIRKISESGKPVVVVMKTLATSAGYMTAVAGDHVIARNGSITGSIGVLVQSAEFTELAETLGIKLESFKSSPLKANPSPTEKTEPKAAEAMTAAVLSFYDYFVEIVAERRNMEIEAVKVIADGRVFTGRQAIELGLIDQLGGEDEALNWLRSEKNISNEIKVEDISIIQPDNSLSTVLFGGGKQNSIIQQLSLKGLLAIWSPNF